MNNKEFRITQKKETVIATANNLIDALTDALLKIKPRTNTNINTVNRVTVVIQITEEVKNGNSKQ